MPNSIDRRQFLQSVATGVGVAALSSVRNAAAAPAKKDKLPLRLAVASYSFRRFPLDKALEMTRQLDIDAICLKSFHLPLNAAPDAIAGAAAQVKDSGVTLYGGGVVPMKKPEQVEQAFPYAKAAGMQRLIISPSESTLSLINDKVQEFDIQVCIHNHGPGDRLFPTPLEAYERIRSLDPRFGLCHDVGHTTRYGADPVAITRRCADRILDVHFKDVSSASKSGHSVPCGRGVIDIPALLQAFIDIEYKGYLAFEYEASADNPLPGLAESVGFVRGVLRAL